MKKKVLSALLAACMVFGSASALPEDTFVDDVSITSAAAESEETSWWEDVTLESYDVYDGNERYKIAGFHNSTVTSIFLNYRCLNKNEHYQDLCACIGEKAFNGYYHNLHKINIDSYYKVIEKDAFINSFNLTEYIIPGTVKSIGSHAIGYELDNGEYKKIENFDKIKIICTKDSAAEKYAIDNGIDYEINDPNFDYVLRKDDTYKITGYHGDERDCLVIPSAYRGKKVTFIGSSALCWIHAKEVVIPDSVIAIEPEAFSGNTRVKKVTIGKGVKRIPYGCFESSGLETIVFSEGLEEIGYNAFLFCTKLKEIKTPSTLEKIGEYAFNCCYDLKTVQLNDGITDISEGAFWGSGLETINLPKSITFIGAKAFRSTPWLENKRKQTSVIQINDLIIDGASVNATGVIIGDDVKHVCDEAFYDSARGGGDFIYLTIRSGVETIGHDAFNSCLYTRSLDIEDGLKEIKDRAFYNCRSLEEVTIPKSVTKIGEKAFGYYAGDDRNPNFLIKCYKDSAAHKYALANDLKIELLDVKHDKSHTLTKVPAKEATCISEGNKLYYRCDQCGRWYSDAAGTKLIEDHSKFVIKEDWSKHNWGTPTFTWADDYSTCYGSRRCLRDSSHGLDEKVDTTVKVKIPATCTAKGTNTYIANFTYLTKEPQTKDVQNIDPLGHKWGKPTYTWSKDYKTCTATIVCLNDKNHKQTETVSTTSKKTKDPTCATKGVTTYTAKFKNTAFGTATKPVENIAALGHNWGKATYKWSADKKTCTATHTCTRNSKHVESEKVTATYTVTTKPTTKTTGVGTYTATFTKSGFAKQTAKITLPKEKYVWGNPTYTWTKTKTGYTCTATRIATNDKTQKQTETVTATYKRTKAPTCTAKGVGTYSAIFKNTAFSTQTKNIGIAIVAHKLGSWTTTKKATCTADGIQTRKCSVCGKTETKTIKATGHSWGKATYKWSADKKTCTATHTCTRNSKHVESEKVTATYTVTTKPTTKTTGVGTYTATFTKSGFAKQTAKITLPKEKYVWGNPTYTWTKTKTGYTCTATRIATNDKTQKQTETVTATYKRTKAPTCAAKGVGTYSAIFKNTSFSTQTKNIDIAMVAHKVTNWTTKSFNVDKGTSTQTGKCTLCGKIQTRTVKNAVVRYAGANRYDTAAMLSKASHKTTSDTVIIADAMTFQDALIAVPLAKAYNAPLLLANPNTVTKQTEAELARLKAKKVIIVNTNNALKSGTINDLKKKYSTQIIRGNNCFETSKRVAEELQKKTKKAPTDVFFTTNKAFADALSISPVAALKGAPILYVDPSKKTLDSNILAYLNKVKGSIKNVYIVGGKVAVPAAIENSIKKALPKKNVKRFDGAQRYETCVMINKYFAKDLSSKTVCIAKGLDFPDALAGGVFAANQKAPLLLADSALRDAHKSFLKDKKPNKLYIFGGKVAVPDKLAKEVAKMSV